MNDRILQSSLRDVDRSAAESGEKRPRRALARRTTSEPAMGSADEGTAALAGEASRRADAEPRKARPSRALRRQRRADQEGNFALAPTQPPERVGLTEILPAQPISLPPSIDEDEGGYTFRKLLKHSFIGMVIAPVIVVAMFFTFIAAEQYGATSRLTVRGTSASTGTEFGSLLGGFGGALTDQAVDSYVLVEYIHSPEVVQALIDRADFLRVYTRPEADFWYRLDPNAPIEDLVEYWEMMSSIEFNPETQISELTVRAFRPEDAERIARTVLEMSEQLVNELSRRAREDALRMANEEVRRAEERFRASRAATALYRDTEREIDPVATATAQQTILSTLESELAQREAEMNALLTTMSPQSPRVIYVRTQIDALRQQIKNQRADLGTSGDQGVGDEPALTKRLSRYEELVAEQTFADVALQSARQSLETARVDADKQNRYLSVFVTPTVPQDSEYPEAIRWTAIVGVGCLLLWGVFSLLSSIVRDHVT